MLPKDKKYGSIKDRSVSKEYRENLSNSIKNYFKTHSVWNKGLKGCYKQTIEANLKRSLKLKGKKKNLTPKGKKAKSDRMKKRWKDIKYQQKMSKIVSKSNKRRKGEHKPSGNSGSSNGRYIDGRTQKWKVVRTKCFERDDYTCLLCNKRGNVYLNSHHIIDRHHCKDIFDINNLVTLCVNCHSRITNIEQTNEYNKYKKFFNDYLKEVI